MEIVPRRNPEKQKAPKVAAFEAQNPVIANDQDLEFGSGTFPDVQCRSAVMDTQSSSAVRYHLVSYALLDRMLLRLRPVAEH